MMANNALFVAQNNMEVLYGERIIKKKKNIRKMKPDEHIFSSF
jgi:hypothetical protein